MLCHQKCNCLQNDKALLSIRKFNVALFGVDLCENEPCAGNILIHFPQQTGLSSFVWPISIIKPISFLNVINKLQKMKMTFHFIRWINWNMSWCYCSTYCHLYNLMGQHPRNKNQILWINQIYMCCSYVEFRPQNHNKITSEK